MKNLLKRFLGVALLLVTCTNAEGPSLSLSLGEGGSATAGVFQIVAIMTVLGLAPSILIAVTSFTRLVIVFSFVRNAIGLQQSPPNMALISLSLFLTGFIMAPVIEKAYDEGVKPLLEEEITHEEAFTKISSPIKEFMLKNTRTNEIDLLYNISKQERPKQVLETPLKIAAPAFMLSELRRAFEIGFLIYLPFVIIDMVVASVLMSMGMMMLPPVMISLPFKLLFFVMIDGWYMLTGQLVQSFRF